MKDRYKVSGKCDKADAKKKKQKKFYCIALYRSDRTAHQNMQKQNYIQGDLPTISYDFLKDNRCASSVKRWFSIYRDFFFYKSAFNLIKMNSFWRCFHFKIVYTSCLKTLLRNLSGLIWVRSHGIPHIFYRHR